MADALELTVDGRAVRVSNPDKVYFPERGITKGDVVQYFLAVGEGILHALHERPTTLERWPGGVVPGAKVSTRQDHRGDAFFQKRVPKGAPEWVQTARIAFPSGRYADEVCPTELAVVVWAANLGTLTFHPWPVRRPEVDHPDQLRIDLDPQPGTDFRDAVRVAHELRPLLEELGMRGFPKTSGGRGLHVYVPIQPKWTFVEARRALIAHGRELERRLPDRVTVKWWKEERGERIFIDTPIGGNPHSGRGGAGPGSGVVSVPAVRVRASAITKSRSGTAPGRGVAARGAFQALAGAVNREPQLALPA